MTHFVLTVKNKGTKTNVSFSTLSEAEIAFNEFLSDSPEYNTKWSMSLSEVKNLFGMRSKTTKLWSFTKR